MSAAKPVKPHMRRNRLIRWTSVLLIFIIINFVVRMALLPINEAEYTDGILQVTQFESPTGIWPPLYTAFVWPLHHLFGYLWAGRLVSTLFSIAAIIPLFLMSRRSFGYQAALFTALLYTVAPITLRWSPRVMTDAQFSFFFWFACERILAAQSSKDAKQANNCLLMANILGVLAALTRYQGMMLILPVIAISIIQARLWQFIPWRGLLSLGLYALPPIWSRFAGNIHGSQFSERAGENLVLTTLMNAETFLLTLPYFLTYPVALMAGIGLTRGRARPWLWMKPLTIYVLLTLLIFQGAFGSFQERYMLPAAGLLIVWAGLGMAAMDNILRKSPHAIHNRLRPYIPIVVTVWSFSISVLVLGGSRQAFGDIRFAAERAAELAQPDSIIYTNEIYRAREENIIAADKVRFFADHETEYLLPEFYTGEQRMRPGDLLVFSRTYGGGEQFAALNRIYELEEAGAYQAFVLPIFPDIMSTPGTAQNLIGWIYRYQWQTFQSEVYVVRRVKVS